MAEVSIVIPCYNAEKYIFSAIESILNQSFTDLEVIVVDDKSTDGSLQALKKIVDKRLKIIALKQNSGYPTAMKIGIENASGTYIARMDADDISTKNRIEIQLNVLKQSPNVAFVSSNRFRILPSGEAYINSQNFQTETIVETWENLIENKRFFVDAGTLFSKQKYLDVGGYRTYQRSGMDVDLWLRLLEKNQPAIVLTASLYGHRLLPESIIFSEGTSEKNQIPRDLAKFRIENKVMIGDDIKQFVFERKISSSNSDSNLNINTGMAATCLYFFDFRGAYDFYNSAFKSSKVKKVTIIKSICIKLVQRIRSSELKKFKYI
jgi:glycosyltransferase involved in cell wall biosynthesis